MTMLLTYFWIKFDHVWFDELSLVPTKDFSRLFKNNSVLKVKKFVNLVFYEKSYVALCKVISLTNQSCIFKNIICRILFRGHIVCNYIVDFLPSNHMNKSIMTKMQDINKKN